MAIDHKKISVKKKKAEKKIDLRSFRFAQLFDDIKKNWVDIKTITKRITGFQARNLQT